MILLLSAALIKLQEVLNIFYGFGFEWHISFNPKKSNLCAFGVRCMPETILSLGAINIVGCENFYLGVILVG